MNNIVQRLHGPAADNTACALLFGATAFPACADTLTLRIGQVRMEENVADNPPPRPVSSMSEPPSADGVIIPADTMVTIRMVDSVNSDTTRLGQTFMASLGEPTVVTKLVYDQNAGKLQGRAVLERALFSLRANGRCVALSGSNVHTESASQGIAGGGKGAATGSGAAIGTCTAVMTSGEKVVIPSETRLTFRLQSPAQL